MVTGMSDEFTTFAQHARIKVCGVGGGGGNAVDRMISAGLQDVDFIVINTDAQALKNSPAPRRLQIGLEETGGLGSGGKPEIGRKAALEDQERLTEALRGADMVFLTAGMGGGTGTGAAPVVAEIARSTGALTLGIVTLPFSFEGKIRCENAMAGLAALEKAVNSLIVIPNDRVAALGRNRITFLNAFEQADEVLHNGVRAITQLIQVHGLWNVDFADFRTVMDGGGRALMGIGRAQGERRAVCAAEEAIVCPLLEQSSINGATGVIVNIRGGRDIGMREVEEAVTVVKEAAHPQATLFVGAALDDEEHPELEVTVIAAGFSADTASDAFAEVFSRQEHYSFSREPEPEQAPVIHEEVEPEPQQESHVRVHPDGQIDLLPDDDAAKTPDAPHPAAEPEPAPYREDEDIAIPTWFRKRRKF